MSSNQFLPPNTNTDNCDSGDSNDYNNVGRDLSFLGSLIAGIARWSISLAFIVLPLVLAFAIVYFIVEKITLPSVLLMILLTIMLYIFLNNMTGSNLAGSLPRATYPIPPHLGLDGISLTNRSLSSF